MNLIVNFFSIQTYKRYFEGANKKSNTESSAPAAHLHIILEEIRELIKTYKKAGTSSDDEPKDFSNVKMESFDDRQRILLHNVYLKPGSSIKKNSGTVEAFKNGFVFTKISGEKTKIPYNALEVAIYQPCTDNSYTISIHLRLNCSIIVGTKKTKDLAFFTEVTGAVINLYAPENKRRKTNYDDDDDDDDGSEQYARRMRATFINFCKNVEEKTNELVSFERPNEETRFTGNPAKAATEIMISNSFLISVIEWPVFILDLSQVELIYFERDIEGLKTLDAAFILKDYTKPVVIIRSILRSDLNMLRTWFK